MTPGASRDVPPPFNQIGAEKFQEMCADLMAADPVYVNPVVYGRNGQSQRGIDIEAPLRGQNGLDVAQCKAWSIPKPWPNIWDVLVKLDGDDLVFVSQTIERSIEPKEMPVSR